MDDRDLSTRVFVHYWATTIPQRTFLAAFLLVAITLLGGCGDTEDTSMTDNPEQTWDLREPPTREQVDMDDGDNTVIFETDQPRQVRLKLPENTALTLPLTLLTFDSYGSDVSDDAEPVDLDGKTDRVSLDETIDLYRSTLEQLDMPTDTIAEFQEQATAADGAEHPADRITSTRVKQEYGYMHLQVLAQYEPDSQVGYIKISGVWGGGLPKRWQEDTEQ